MAAASEMQFLAGDAQFFRGAGPVAPCPHQRRPDKALLEGAAGFFKPPRRGRLRRTEAGRQAVASWLHKHDIIVD